MISPDGDIVHPPAPEDERGTNIARLPAPKNRPPHIFGDPVSINPDPFRARHQQTERTCSVCQLVKVTVHHPDGRAWREWRLPRCADQIDDDQGAPACIVAGPATP